MNDLEVFVTVLQFSHNLKFFKKYKSRRGGIFSKVFSVFWVISIMVSINY